jgi:quinol monooxygenase YgiN
VPQLVIVAHIRARPGEEARVRTELERVIPPTRAEEGCVKYDLHVDDEDPAHFMFYEIWETKPHWEAHQRSDHLSAMRAATEGARESVTVYQMTHVA